MQEVDSSPLYSAIKNYIKQDNLRLHMPGHAGGKGFIDQALREFASMDLTEVPGLDDLYMPEGAIKESIELMAKAYGAQESFFLVNGASSGIHALLMAVACDNDKVFIPRNAHRSFYGGLVLSGAIPVYIPCEIDEDLGVALSVSTDSLKERLEDNRDAKAIFVCSPSYYGSCSDISTIVELASGIEVIVDEAHGAHFPFHPAYPESALSCGAAAVVNGLHKTLPVLTQGACLHLGKGFSAANRVRNTFSLLSTSSPSYLIMASLDLARDFMEKKGKGLLENARQLSREYKEKINGIKGFRCYGDDLLEHKGVKAVDPLKVLIAVNGLSISGIQVGEILRQKYGIQLELTDDKLLLAMFSMFHERKDWDRLFKALREISWGYSAQKICQKPPKFLPEPIVVYSPRRAFQLSRRRVTLREARGKVSAEMIAAYPPGIPALLPGEIVSPDVLEYLQEVKKDRLHIQGAEDPELNTIMIIDD